MEFSIVIPTYKEEKYLPNLLNSIKKQTFQPKEIIIADNNSPDKTQEIAKSYNCKIVTGGNPAEGRNSGGKAATSSLLIFLDADVRLGNKDFLEKAVNNFINRKLDIATGFAKNERDNKLIAKIPLWIGNIRKAINLITNPFLKDVPGGSGWFIMVKKSVFTSVGGFNKNVMHEDTDFLGKVVKSKYKFGLMPFTNKLFLSGRRHHKLTYLQLVEMGVCLLVLDLGIGNKERFRNKYEHTKGPLGGS